MIRSKLTSWLFLGYLVLLLNFGPSLHHAPIFGLHGHHHNHSGDFGAHSSCCCQNHFHQDTLIPSLAPEAPSTDLEFSADAFNNARQTNHSCAFCKFFDEYNVVVASFECDVIESPFSLFVAEHADSVSAQLVPNIARGPPVA